MNDTLSFRKLLQFLKEEGELVVSHAEVDPIYEVAGILKTLENGSAILFERVKGYPNVRIAGNVFTRREALGKVFDVDPKKLKFKLLSAISNPIPPSFIENPPCQEVIIDKTIDIEAILPLIKHTERDGGRILGGGIYFLGGKYAWGGKELSFKRTHFRGKDWGSVWIVRGSHMADSIRREFKGEKIPATINIGVSPAVMLLAAGGPDHRILPGGVDEVAIAGGLQGSPIEISKAKTIDGYCLSQSEWVIEGYFDSSEKVWETEEAERIGREREAPFFPEFHRWLGRASKGIKFVVTAITHRKERPIFYAPLADSFESDNLQNPAIEATLFELSNRLYPGFVQDINILPSQASGVGIVIQVKKRGAGDDGHVRSLLANILAGELGINLAIIVDEYVDIYSTDDVLWAVTTLTNPLSGIIDLKGIGGGVTALLTLGDKRQELGGSIGIDATIPFTQRRFFERPHYPVDKIDLTKHFSEETILKIKTRQSDYARLLAQKGW